LAGAKRTCRQALRQKLKNCWSRALRLLRPSASVVADGTRQERRKRALGLPLAPKRDWQASIWGAAKFGFGSAHGGVGVISPLSRRPRSDAGAVKKSQIGYRGCPEVALSPAGAGPRPPSIRARAARNEGPSKV